MEGRGSRDGGAAEGRKRGGKWGGGRWGAGANSRKRRGVGNDRKKRVGPKFRTAVASADLGPDQTRDKGRRS